MMANSLAISVASLLSFAFVAGGCDKTPPSAAGAADASASVPARGAAATADTPKPPRIYVTPDAVIIGDQKLDANAASFAALASNAVSGAPLVAGATVEIDADRRAKLASVHSVFAGLARANARAEVHTTTRDKLDLLVVFSFPKGASDCAVVADIAKDNAISVWTVGGTPAKRFTHGFAGPDITLGSDAVRKLAVPCDSGVWLVAAEESVPWGSVFDLAAAAMGVADGGVAMHTPDVALLASEPVAGRKVTIE
jgi:hypothetical protein